MTAILQAKLLFAVSQSYDDDDNDDAENDENLDFDEFLMSLASIAVFLNPSPFITPAVNTQRILALNFASKSKEEKSASPKPGLEQVGLRCLWCSGKCSVVEELSNILRAVGSVGNNQPQPISTAVLLSAFRGQGVHSVRKLLMLASPPACEGWIYDSRRMITFKKTKCTSFFHWPNVICLRFV
jgi:hypothetical protein